MIINLMKKSAVLFVLIAMVSIVFSTSYNRVFASNIDLDSEKAYSIQSSEERFLESLAQKYNITVEEAKVINEQENQKILEKYQNDTEIVPYGYDEVIRYKTVYKQFDIVNAPQNVEIAVEVKYVYSIPYNTAIEIISVGNPLLYIPGASSLTINSGGFNIETTSTSARVSNTASLVYTVSSSYGISVGGDIISIDESTNETFIVSTKAKTYVFNIYLNNL